MINVTGYMIWVSFNLYYSRSARAFWRVSAIAHARRDWQSASRVQSRATRRLPR